MSSSDYEPEDKKADNSKKFVETNEYVMFGNPIELNEEELETGKKIMRVEDQIATDEKGRRRFHGAFTGGFSAGYFNTCGSQEGWTPTTFVSSRSDRFQNNDQKPESYMDEEDFSEFGIAPKKYSTKSKYTIKNPKIKQEIDSSMESHKVLRDVIPEEQLYYSLNIIPKQSVGYDLLRKLGWKEGRGFGEKTGVTTVAKKTYGCELPGHLKKTQSVFILPKDSCVKIPPKKSNLFGIGYISLRSQAEVLQTTGTKSDFKPTGEEKRGIKGSAYGVGVFDESEPEDEIYHENTMEKYDFSIEPVQESDQKLDSVTIGKRWHGFIKPATKSQFDEHQYNLPVIPDSYHPRPTLGVDVTATYSQCPRKYFTTKSRAKVINDQTDKIIDKPIIPMSTFLTSKFVSSGQIAEGLIEAPNKDKIEAAKSGQHGKLTRTQENWSPSDVLCRRFNIVCVGARGSDKLTMKKPSIVTEKKSITNFKITQSASIQGPLSILNPDKEGVIDEKEAVDVKVTGEDVPTEVDSFVKPSIDLFKAVFCDDSDDEPLEDKASQSAKRSSLNLNNTNISKKFRVS